MASSTTSLAEQLAEADAPTREEILAQLSDASCEALLHDWTFWARPEQLPPDNDDWDVFLLLGGRGSGKTRPCAEIIHQWAEHPGWYLALVGETSAEVRDVMLEGESGILATQKPDNPCVYEPSKRRVVWPKTGTWATTFSGDSPDQLRGPNCHGAWVDELCLAAGTMIETQQGTVPIEHIRPGMQVWTRQGLRRVTHARMTHAAAQVFQLCTEDGRELIGTGNHPIWVENKGFIPLRNVSSCDILRVWDKTKTYHELSSGAASDGGSWETTIKTGEGNSYIESSIRPHMDLSLRASRYTTKTKTKQIMPLRIWRDLHGQSISSGIGRAGGTQGHTKNSAKNNTENGPWVRHGNPSLVYAGNVTKTIWEKRLGHSTALIFVDDSITDNFQPIKSHGYAWNASDTLWPQPGMAEHIIFVLRPVSTGGTPVSLQSSRHEGLVSVLSAPSHFAQAIHARHAVQKPVGINSSPRVRHSVALPGKRPVYNLEVEEVPEYFANGILTHNCKFFYPDDTWNNLEMVLRAGEHPRVVVSTTPRPIPLLKSLIASARTVVRRYSTYANIANLAPTFIRRILERYEGTRLGRQELHAEILEDNPDALWSHSLLDATRVAQPPRVFDAVAIGIDPPGGLVTECGIVASGRSPDGQGYVLADRSTAGRPEQWARAAWAMAEWLAETYDVRPWLIAEKNHGGEMVRSTLEVARPKGCSFRVELVTASQGKVARAEPVVMLYEQGRYHHVGTYPALEDEMTQWTPLDPSLPSPNRLDGLVWSAHGLKLVGTTLERAGTWGR